MFEDSVSLTITSMQDAAMTPKADISAKLVLGEPVIEKGSAKATVQITNQDDKSHSFTARAGFLRAEELVGYAEKVVTSLAAGDRRASLSAMNTVSSYDRVQVSIVGAIN